MEVFPYKISESFTSWVEELYKKLSWLAKVRYWGRHFWAIGYGAWSTGNITDEIVHEYLEHHREKSNEENDSFILD